MTAERVERVVHRKPFRPFKVRLSGGEEIVVAARLRAVVSADRLIVATSDDPYAPPEQRRLRIIPVQQVESIGNIRPPRRTSTG